MYSTCQLITLMLGLTLLSWLQGSPRRFKVFVGNRVAQIMELIPPERWRHVVSQDNPADCASHGMYPSELLTHDLWWNGPDWLKLNSPQWPEQSEANSPSTSEEAEELCSATCTTIVQNPPLIPTFDFHSPHSSNRMGYSIHQQLSIEYSEQTSNQQTFVCTRVETLYKLLDQSSSE